MPCNDSVLEEQGGGGVMSESQMQTDRLTWTDASNKVEKETEEILLRVALHVKRSDYQREGYQIVNEEAVECKLNNKLRSQTTYLFVVDFGQNLELPTFMKEEPAMTYYFSPLTVYNLGIVSHAHNRPDGMVDDHMHAHIYCKGIGKKQADNVASLKMKTLRVANTV